MSLARPLRCAFALSRQSASARHLRCSFHTSTLRGDEDTKSAVPRRPASLTTPKQISKEEAAKVLPHYSAEELELLKQQYTPEQMAAIEAGERAIDPTDLYNQGALRDDPMSVKYLDDFSKIDPVIDKQPLAPDENYDPNLRFKDEDEIAADLTKWLENLPDDPDPVEFQKFLNDTRVMVGKEEAEMNSRDYSAPELPKLTDPLVRRQVRAMKGKDGTEVMTEHLQRLSKQTGMSTQFLRSLRWKHLVRHRVTNQTRLGKIHSMYYLTVAGNENGLLGIGEGKSTVDEEAARNALLKAYRNLTPIPRYENRTIFGDVKGKVGATELELYTRPPGFGIRCQDKIFEMCKCAGISDMSARVTRSRNPMNTVKAAFQALLSQRLPEDVARARGRKMVDVRKVYYADNL